MVRALANLRDSGNDITYDKSTLVSLGESDPTLEVYSVEENALIASSEDVMPDFPYEGFSTDPIPIAQIIPTYTSLNSSRSFQNKTKQAVNLGRLNDVFLKRIDDQGTLKIVLTNGPQNENSLDVYVYYRPTWPTWPEILPNPSCKITLTKVPDKDREFQGYLTFGPPGSSSDVSMKRIFDNFSSYDFTSDPSKGDIADSEAFINGEKKRGLAEQGIAHYFEKRPKETVPTKTYPSASAFIAAGFEDIAFLYTQNNMIKHAYVHVKNQTEEFYFSGHGSHKCGGVQYKHGDLLLPGELTNHWKDNLKVGILACCSVLDIGEFNDNFFGKLDEKIADPGLMWDSLFINNSGFRNNARLLGYNYIAPSVGYDVRIINEYFKQLQLGKNSDMKSIESCIEPVAWINANLKESDYDTACAISPEYYYYISFVRKKLFAYTNHQGSLPSPNRWLHTKREVLAVNQKYWRGGKPISKIARRHMKKINKNELLDKESPIPVAD
jgi:hypothetical protein